MRVGSNNFQSPQTPPPEQPMDGTQAVGAMMDEIWLLMQQMQNGNDTSSTIEALMAAVNRFNAYCQANGGPSEAMNPKTWDVWMMINKLTIFSDSQGNSYTLGSLSSDLGQSNQAAAVSILEDPGAQMLMLNNIYTSIAGGGNYSGWYPGGWHTAYNNNTSAIETDVTDLLDDLQTYSSRKPPRASDIENIAADIAQYEKDVANLPGGKVTDGYLLPLDDFLNSTGLITLANAVNANPGNQQDLQAFQTALNNVAGAQGSTLNVAQSLTSLIQQVLQEEF